jgi:hypothetical protein
MRCGSRSETAKAKVSAGPRRALLYERGCLPAGSARNMARARGRAEAASRVNRSIARFVCEEILSRQAAVIVARPKLLGDGARKH